MRITLILNGNAQRRLSKLACHVLLLFFLLALVAACQSTTAPPLPEGPTVGDVPITAGAQPLEPESLRIGLAVATQVHGEMVDDEVVGHFRVEEEFLDIVEYYDNEMKRLGWELVDTLPFGDGGNIRRYYQGEQRAILAFEPEDGGTEFMLMQGTVR